MVGSVAVSQTVILAAGYGSRLGKEADGGLPKPLVRVAGVPLIAHALEHARASGCHRAIVVVGHEGDQIRTAVGQMQVGLDVVFVENPHTSDPNGVSLLMAEPLAASVFYLQMVDHVFGGTALPLLTAEPFVPGEAGRLLVDASPSVPDVSDATKVRVRSGAIVAIGKQIESWNAVDTGCFVLTHAIFEALRSVRPSEPRTVSSGMRQLARHRSLSAVEIGNLEWIDVDTPLDRAAAEVLVANQRLSAAETR
jgi:choline kinase